MRIQKWTNRASFIVRRISSWIYDWINFFLNPIHKSVDEKPADLMLYMDLLLVSLFSYYKVIILLFSKYSIFIPTYFIFKKK